MRLVTYWGCNSTDSDGEIYEPEPRGRPLGTEINSGG
jgi:hypothetical protein